MFGLKTWGPGEEVCVQICSSKADVNKRLEHQGRRGIERSVGEHEQRSRTLCTLSEDVELWIWLGVSVQGWFTPDTSVPLLFSLFSFYFLFFPPSLLFMCIDNFSHVVWKSNNLGRFRSSVD